MRKLVVSMLAPALASILGCIDATPSDFSVPDAGAGGQPDVDYSDLPADAIPPGPIEVCRACLRSAERVISVIAPSGFTTRHWKKQKPNVS